VKGEVVFHSLALIELRFRTALMSGSENQVRQIRPHLPLPFSCFFSLTFSTNDAECPPTVGLYMSSTRAGVMRNSPANYVSTTYSAAIAPFTFS
jgi:hypothetical protein